MRSPGTIRRSGRADYSTAARICQFAASRSPMLPRGASASRGLCDCFFGDCSWRSVPWPRRLSCLVALLGLRDRCSGRRFLRRLAILRQLFQLRFEFGLPCRDLFHQFSVALSRNAASSSMLRRIQIDFCHAGLLFPLATGKVHVPQEAAGLIHRDVASPRRRCGFAHAGDVSCTPRRCALRTGITILQRDIPIRAPISIANARGTRLEKKGWA